MKSGATDFIFLADVLFFFAFCLFHNPVIGNLIQRVDYIDIERLGRAGQRNILDFNFRVK